MRGFFIAVLLALLQVGVAQAETIEVNGVKYETQLDLGGQKLVLNGAGIRYKFVVKVYTAGLYLGAKAETPEAVLALPGAKRIHIVMLREIDGNDLGKLFVKGIEKNSTREEFVKSFNGVLKFGEIFSGRKSLQTGESFSVDYLPGTGTVVLINGKPQGEPIKEPEFYAAMLRIWLGKDPADDNLKEALLGAVKKERPRRERAERPAERASN